MEPVSDHHRTVTTAAVWEWAELNPNRFAWVVACHRRHQTDDWGDLDDEDRAANAAARRDGDGRLFSVYRTPVELRGDDAPMWMGGCGSSPTTSTTRTGTRRFCGRATIER